MLSILTAVNDRLYKVMHTLCGVLLAVFALCVFIQVVTRNYIHFNLPWTSELSLLCFVWGVMLGSAVAVREGRHYVVDFLPASCSKFVGGLDLVAMGVCLFIFFVLIKTGYDFSMLGLNRRGNSVPISMAWTFASIPVSASAMVLFGVEVLWKKINDVRAGCACDARTVEEGTCDE
ncbi:TRAP transporter small permease [Desulfocurvus sp. DL9XJH121]